MLSTMARRKAQWPRLVGVVSTVSEINRGRTARPNSQNSKDHCLLADARNARLAKLSGVLIGSSSSKHIDIGS
jgi:hypothetical protein